MGRKQNLKRWIRLNSTDMRHVWSSDPADRLARLKALKNDLRFEYKFDARTQAEVNEMRHLLQQIEIAS